MYLTTDGLEPEPGRARVAPNYGRARRSSSSGLGQAIDMSGFEGALYAPGAERQAARQAYRQSQRRAQAADGEVATGCPQPVTTAERDDLKDRISARYFDWQGQTPSLFGPGGHWHEGHPGIKAYLNDLMPRMLGLYKRPKLLRCSKEARHRGEEWLNALDELFRKTKVQGKTVVPAGGVTMKTYRMPDYHFAGPWPKNGAAASSGGGAAAGPGPSGGGTPALFPPEVLGVWESITTGDVYGIPKVYLTYGFIGLIALRFLRR